MPRTTELASAKKDQILRILDLLRARGATNDKCWRCSHDDWNADLCAVPVVQLPNSNLAMGYPQSSNAYIPVLTITCKTCGNLLMHNLNQLDVNWWEV